MPHPSSSRAAKQKAERYASQNTADLANRRTKDFAKQRINAFVEDSAIRSADPSNTLFALKSAQIRTEKAKGDAKIASTEARLAAIEQEEIAKKRAREIQYKHDIASIYAKLDVPKKKKTQFKETCHQSVHILTHPSKQTLSSNRIQSVQFLREMAKETGFTQEQTKGIFAIINPVRLRSLNETIFAKYAEQDLEKLIRIFEKQMKK